MHEYQAILEFAPRFGRRIGRVQNSMLGHEPATTDAELRIAFASEHTLNELHARPDATRILPATARPPKPFAKQSASQNQSAFTFLQLTCQRSRLSSGAHADAHQSGKQCRRDREARALGNVIDAAGDFQPTARPDHAGEQFGQALA